MDIERSASKLRLHRRFDLFDEVKGPMAMFLSLMR